VLNIRPLVGAVPTQILGKFRRQLQQSNQPVALQFLPENQPSTLFTLLQNWKQKTLKFDATPQSFIDSLPFIGKSGHSRLADFVSLSDYWLQKAIQQQLIQPIEIQSIKGWDTLAPTWKALVTRNDQGLLDAKGKVWATPYRWGSLVIGYRKDIFQKQGLQPPTDWADLWRPELQRRISLPNQARQVIGLTLKKLGKSYNTENLEKVPQLESELRSLHQQVKLYSSDTYLQPLTLGDTWVAVGWSSDIVLSIQRSSQIAAVVPKSGTNLWCDLWVRPIGAQSELSTAALEWLNFCWQPQIATSWTLMSETASPVVTSVSVDKLLLELGQNRLLLPEPTILQESEFLLPLPDAAISQYQDLWQRLRKGL
jgi:putative spermidine/putrescine transport system substrate-binding protein